MHKGLSGISFQSAIDSRTMEVTRWNRESTGAVWRWKYFFSERFV